MSDAQLALAAISFLLGFIQGAALMMLGVCIWEGRLKWAAIMFALFLAPTIVIQIAKAAAACPTP